MNEFVTKDFTEFTKAIVTLTRGYRDTRAWWRGQANAAWGLVPSLYRSGFATNKESNINGRFRMMAKARHLSCPTSDDLFGWLFLMQHYRLPTRLLDWSESPLVGLYFAMGSEAADDMDATLWALCPTGLNLHQLKREAICTPGIKDLIPLCREAFVANQTSPDCRIIAVQTEQSDIRHMIQQSVFTIHGCGTPMGDLPGADQYLARIQIPAKSKREFRQVLALFGISRAVLFPDLENLAAELASLEFVLHAEPAAPGTAKRCREV